MKEHVLNSKEPLSTQQPKKVVFVEMFRAGPQISSTGQKMVFTESDLDEVIKSYDPQHHEAPLIIGHDQDDGTPSLGWVQKIWRKGAELWGKVELTPKAEKLIRDGVFKKVSSSFYLPEAETNPTPGRLSLRHLGLVSIPAVKGLTAFSEGNDPTEEQTITITPSEGESSISFKENLGKTLIMARKKTKPETPASVASVVDHGEGGMTVNINIGGGNSKPEVYDDGGSPVMESGSPAPYDMDYGMEGGGMPSEDPMMTSSMADEELPPEDDEMGMEGETDGPPEEGEEGGDEEMPPMEDEDGEDPGMDGEDPGMGGDEPSEPGMETDDISGDMEGADERVAQLASEYELEELIKALALKTDAASMMESGGDMSYGEMPEGLKKAIEAKKDGNDDKQEDEEDDESADHASCGDKTDMGEEVPGAEKPKEASHPTSEEVKGAEEPKGEIAHSEESASMGEDEDEDDEEKKKKAMMMEKSDMSEETTETEHSKDAVATGTLDHSESAMGDRGQKDLQARVAELEEELNRQKKLMREKEISDFTETLYSQAKLTEQIVSKTDLVRFMETLNSKNSVNFSEAGKASQFDFFKGVLENLPAMVSFEEMATPASAPKGKKQPTPSANGYIYDPKTTELHAQALEYSEAKGVEYTVALKAILSD